jgi:hypothetical protein
MAVRIQKSAVNIREKLAELERPIGVNGAALMATNTPQEAFSLLGARNRNRIINGSMVLDQRNGGASVNGAAGVYPVDRFEIENITGGGTATGQQSSTAPTGFTNSLLITVTGTDTSLASTDYYTVRQIIEGYNISDLGFGSSSASTVTISFWVRSSVTGIYCFSLGNGGNNRGYATEYTINVANTWEKKVITIPGCTDGTWGTTNGRGIQCRWCMGTGTSRQATVNTWATSEVHGTSNQTNLFATNGATFYLTGVQLEEGKVATPFEFRSYGQELALCQRYYYNTMFINGADSYTAPTTNYMEVQGTRHRVADVTGYQTQVIFHPVIMRSSPNITLYNPNNSGTSAQVALYNFDGTVANSTAVSAQKIRPGSFALWAYTGVTVGTAGMSLISWAHWAASSEL